MFLVSAFRRSSAALLGVALTGIAVASAVACRAQQPTAQSWQGLPDSVLTMWAASAQANRAHYCHPAIDTPTVAVKHFDLGELKKCGPVTQHGVGDTRRLSRYDAGSGQVVTDGPIATIKPILGAVDWPPRYFESPIPIAIIDLPAQNAAYRKLGLLPGRNYWIVMLDHGVWRGWMQSDVQPGGATPPPAVPLEMLNPVPYDAEAPVQNAQFVWYDKDEGLWGVCAGKCCRTKPVL